MTKIFCTFDWFLFFRNIILRPYKHINKKTSSFSLTIFSESYLFQQTEKTMKFVLREICWTSITAYLLTCRFGLRLISEFFFNPYLGLIVSYYLRNLKMAFSILTEFIDYVQRMHVEHSRV